jgi:hypothetical protein
LIQGSQAGTALRTALLSLANPTGQTIDAMEALGINIANADGKMKPLPELIGHIAGKLGGMEAAQKTATVAQLVGTEAASGFIALLDIGEDKLRDYTEQLENSGGTAERVSKTQMDTLNGSFKEFQSALEGLGIKVGNEMIGPFREIVEAGTDVVRFLGDLNTGLIISGTKMTGAAAGTALLITTVGKLGLALRTLSLSPVGTAITGISLLAGILVGAKDNMDRMREVNLDTAKSMIKQHESLDGSIKRYDELRDRTLLTNKQLGRFKDINSEIEKTANPKVIEDLRNEQYELQKNSGLTNDELTEMLELNDEIIKKVPNSTQVFSDQNEAILTSTGRAKDYNREQMEIIRLELETQRIKAESNMKGHLAEEEELVEQIKKHKDEINRLDEEYVTQRGVVRKKEEELIEIKKTGDEGDIKRAETYLRAEEQKLKKIQDRLITQGEFIGKKNEELGLVREELKKLDEVEQQMIDLEMSQTNINAKRGEEIGAIEKEIGKLIEKKKRMDATTDPARKNTEEYRKAVGQIDSQVKKLWDVRSRVLDITSKARSMNYEFGKSIRKEVTVVTKGGAGTDIRRYHTGGIVGKNPINQIPKLHDGGLASKFMNAPMHNEVDVRLLRGEAVLTEAQQANLMRMIDAGLTGGAKPTEQVSRDTSIQQSITINSAEALSPSEIARKNKQALRELAMEWEAR